jgi:divalent metal cation (Fe/Co/Zn/Cd) transporter
VEITALGWLGTRTRHAEHWTPKVCSPAPRFTLLAVILGITGSWLGWHWVNPFIGLAITVAIEFVLKDAARQEYRRLMDHPSTRRQCGCAGR